MKKAFVLLFAFVLLICSLPLAQAEDLAAPVLTLSATEVQLDVGKSAAVKAKIEGAAKGQKATYTWQSSDETVATVKNGNIKGVGSGDTVITCTTELKDGPTLTAEVKVHVLVMVQSIKADQKSLNLAYGQTEQITWTVKPENAQMQDLDWSSSNEAVAMVNAEGKITANVPGKATITGTAKDGSKKTVKVGVTVSKENVPPALQIWIRNIKIKQNSDGVLINIHVTNNTGKVIKGSTIQKHFYNSDGEPVYLHTADKGKIIWNWTSAFWDSPARIGEKFYIYTETAGYQGGKDITHVRAAICKYWLEDGTSIQIPESQLYWFDMKNGYEARLPVTEYTAPSKEIYDKVAEYKLGYSYDELYSTYSMDVASSPEPGLYLYKVEEGSVAERAGLQTNDVIYGMDELVWKDEPNIAVYARSRLLDGQAVTFHLYRNGEQMDIVIHPEDTGWPTETAQ